MSRNEIENNRVAFVYMPWGSIKRPSIAIGILKECAREAGFSADAHYFNIRFAELIGMEFYERISSRSTIHPEWFFSNKLFGPHGLGLVANTWQDLQSSQTGQIMAASIVETVDGSTEACFNILELVEGFIESCVNEVEWEKYKVIGFSVTFAQTMSSLLLAKKLKEAYPHLAIVFGGANVDSEMGFEILKACDWVDYIVHGEAEQALPQLLTAIKQEELPFTRIPGVSARRGTELIEGFLDAQPLANLNESPLPDYSDYFQEIEKYKVEKALRVSLPIESSRGCWWGAKHHCTFCGLNGSTMMFRKKSGDRVYEEIMRLSKRHRNLSFSAVDNILDRGYFRELLPLLARDDIDLSLFYEVKANLTRQQVQMLADSGITSVQPGIESLNTDLLRLMRKGVTAIQNIQFLKWCNEFNVDPLWNILYAFPGESRQNYEDYPRILRLLFHLKPPVAIVPVVFERFSPYHFERERFNLQITPVPDYRLLYPESKVDFNKIAYYFDGTWEGQEGSPEEYIRPVLDVYEEWIKYWQEGEIRFYYEKGPGFITIFDNRPKQYDRDLKMGRLTLNELQSKVYLFCDENRSFNAIQRMLLAEFQTPTTPEQTQKLLNQFVEQGLMFREADRYLSLVVRKSLRRSLHDSEKVDQTQKMPLSVFEQATTSEKPGLPILYQTQ